MSPITFSIKPYILDLESANGTFLNGEKVSANLIFGCSLHFTSY